MLLTSNVIAYAALVDGFSSACARLNGNIVDASLQIAEK
jgi:hypothetical protein